MWSLLFLSVTALLMGGCIEVNSFVEPGHTLVNPHDVYSKANPLPVALNVTFLSNGEPAPENNAHLRLLVSNELYSTGVLKVVPADQAQATLNFTVNNRYDPNQAAGHGMLSGLTLGASGKTVIDHYHFTIILKGEHQPMRRGTYQSAILTTLGNSSAPVSARPVSTRRAYEVVIQQAVLNFLYDLQSAGDGPLPIGFIHD